mmetsp:Transcript_54898/g.86898  ORF Transcript_54898/g.86898 Transcript_54898/m.86898 type:complete len:360 (-) Transcript_54898:61-1140(-)
MTSSIMTSSISVVLHVWCLTAASSEEVTDVAWRLVNSEVVDVVWRVRSLQFFSDLECASPIKAVPNTTGDAFASKESDMTGAEHIFALRSMRGWESAGPCERGECNVGFSWWPSDNIPEVKCLLIQQGETGLHASAMTLQRRQHGAWTDVVSWNSLEGGKVKLALTCPSTPSLENGLVGECESEDDRSKQCSATCSEGFGTVEPRLHCINGAWFVPECLPIGTLVRLVAKLPELIKPYWVILEAALYRNSDCSDVIRMEGKAISSGEFVIKYANYHAQNVWDGNVGTSWASSDQCTPGSCYVGFRFAKSVDGIRCVRIEHPAGKQYQATEVIVETLGASGWEEIPDVTIRLLPQEHQEL